MADKIYKLIFTKDDGSEDVVQFTAPQGEPGPKGDKGDTGLQGIQGETGAAGKDGADGAPGANGKDGVSATHSWNGTTLTITSASGTSSANLKGEKGDKGDTGEQGVQGIQGEKGDKGDKGDTGAPGSPGKDGTSVTVKSVSESTADGGSNVVTFSDGKTVTIKNGSKGSPGAKGDTPVKGTDYFTDAEKQEIAERAAEMVEIPDPAGFVAQDTAPTDTSVLWVDTSDDSNDGFQEAVNMALAQAKASGEFDGKDGTSVTVKSVSESTADGGSNVVTFSDGKTLTVKNGSTGAKPVKGTDYFTAADKAEMVNAVIAALPVYAGEVV